MEALWPWLIVAGMGAVHGAHPANGWMWASVRGVDMRSLAGSWQALWPVALGHVAAIAATLYAVSQGVSISGSWPQRIAGLLLLVAAAGHPGRVGGHAFGASTPGATLLPALSSALMATAHGAGLMLVPALMPLCMSGLPAREITASGSLLLGLAAVIVHLAAMLLTASGIACLLQAGARGWRQRGLGSAASWWSLALAVAGVGMIAMA